MYNNRTYAVVDTEAFTIALTSGQISASLVFENVMETSIETLRHTVTGKDLFILKSNNQTSIAYLTAKAEEFSIPYDLYDHYTNNKKEGKSKINIIVKLLKKP